MSLPEVLLWRELRQSDLKFRRQHPVGPFIVDFYCAAAKLAIEIDGIVHDMSDRPERDAARDAFIGERGITTIRIAAKEVLASPIDSMESIIALCRTRMGH